MQRGGAGRRRGLRTPYTAHASQLLGLIARRGLSWTEAPVVIDYEDETRRRGQSNVHALNFVFDLALERLGSAG